MQPFTRHRGIAAPLPRDNVDTDTITPSRDIGLQRNGLGAVCFAPWRYLNVYSREENPEFVLNQPKYRQSSILISGNNFGCGSSRETAVWALQDIGMRCVVASSFGAIFRNNSVRNGLLPALVDIEALASLRSEANGDEFEVNLETCEITAPSKRVFSFTIDPLDREMLLEGLDAIMLTLKSEEQIREFQKADRNLRPWIWQTLNA